MHVFLKLDVVLIAIRFALFALGLTVEFVPFVARSDDSAVRELAPRPLVGVNVWGEGALLAFRVLLVAQLLLVFLIACVLLSSVDQVIFIAAMHLDLLVLHHFLKYLL